jgi:hypothetical protein
VLALLGVAAMCLFPPWEYTARNGRTRPVGYGFIAAPPDVEILNNDGSVARYDPATGIVWSRLVLQIGAVVSLGTVGFVLAGRAKGE